MNSKIRSFLIFKNNRKRKIPKEFQSDDNRNPENLVEYFLKEFTKKGDTVFDPFAGLGTTLIVSEQMERIPFGMELDKKRANYIKSQIKNKNNLINGNSKNLSSYKLPLFDFCFTSPLYMNNNGKTYKRYLKNLHSIFTQVKNLMKKNSYLVIEASNLKGKDVTTLAWDIEKEVSKVLHFEGEIVIGWEGKDSYGYGGNYGYGYDHSYCLIFRNVK